MTTTTTIKQDLEIQRKAIIQFLETDALEGFPSNLSDSTYHIMTLEGKRLRPIMVLMAAQGFGVSTEAAMCAAISIEVFHNFTLVHDDIMDKAPLRRGTITVHEKYGVDKAIVTGDAMLPHSVALLIKGNEEKAAVLLKSFLKMAQEVMEGQQYDMEFETQETVTVEEYMNMIRLKTSVLFGCACEIGAILGNASLEDQKKLYDFGLYTGLAFQIMDDYLDTFGDDSFGKRIGGDILLNKKTYLLINAMQHANADQKARIEQLFEEKDEEAKISGFQAIFKEIGVAKIALDKMEELHDKSVEAIMSSGLSEDDKRRMIELGEIMLRRTT
jgi:geranylgeranyl diphosphate synthase type II